VLQDPELMMYDVIIVDEVHERHITGDFLLGILRTVLMKRPDLKLILMSATINTELFSSFFWGAPIVNVPGRVFPIDMEYISLDEYINARDETNGKRRRLGREFGGSERIEDDERLFIVSKRDSTSRKQMVQSSNNLGLDAGPYLDIIRRIDQEIASSERGDMLIFVPGMREIDFLSKEIGEYARKTRRWIVLRLHSQLSVEEQDLVFDNPPDDVRKCVISTNIAESSLTIDGIRFVVDSGKVKEMAFDETKRMMSLQEFFISQVCKLQPMKDAWKK
jgi:ATP-dependent RNA helicase DHX34